MPLLRAAAGPAQASWRMTFAPCCAQTRWTAATWVELSSTTMTEDCGQLLLMASRHRASWVSRSRTGTTTVIEAVTVDRSGCGISTPASRSRRASVRAPAREPIGVGRRQPPTIPAPASVSRRTRRGEPPTRTRPPSKTRTAGLSATARWGAGSSWRGLIGSARSHRKPTVDRERGAGHAAGLGAREPGDHGGDLMRVEQSAERLLRGECLSGVERVQER